MFSGHHDPLYALRVVGAFGALWAYRDRIRGWFQAPTPLAIALGLCVGVIWLSVPIAAEIDGSKRYLVSTLGVLGYSGWITLRCLGGIVVVPICEELAFRGYLARRLTQAEFWNVPFTKLSLLGIAGSAIAFGAVHERWALGTLAGFVYAWLVRRSGRLADGIAAHALTNAVIAVWVLTTGNWSHW
jgi:CAAX prenyl protease-like protein